MDEGRIGAVIKHSLFSWAAALLYALSPTLSLAASSCDKSYAEVFRAVAPSVVRVLSMAIEPYSPTAVRCDGWRPQIGSLNSTERCFILVAETMHIGL